MKLNAVSEDLESIQILEDLFLTAKKFYLEFYLLNDRRSGINLRKQIKEIELQLKIIYDESLDLARMRKAHGFNLSRVALQNARNVLKTELGHDSKN